MATFIKLFEPGVIGNLELKNRIVMPAMGNHWTTDGYVTQRHLDYYAERAKPFCNIKIMCRVVKLYGEF